MAYNVIDPNSNLFNRFTSDELNLTFDRNEKRINEMTNPIFQLGIEANYDIDFMSDANYNNTNFSFSWGHKHCLRLILNQAIMPPSSSRTLTWTRATSSSTDTNYYYNYYYGFGTSYRYTTTYTKTSSENQQPYTKSLTRTDAFPAIMTIGYVTQAPLVTMRFMGIDPATGKKYLFIINQGTGIIQALAPIPSGVILNFDFL